MTKKAYTIGQIIDILCDFRDVDWEEFKRTVNNLRAVREYGKFKELPTDETERPS